MSLALLAQKQEKVQPGFSVFRYAGRIPVIADGALAQLRILEDKAAMRAEMARRKAMRRQQVEMAVGSAVAITDGPYKGLTGTIDKVKRQNAVVRLMGNHYVTVGAWLLRTDEAQGLEPVAGTAA
jgi:transcription termination/antitermination protein NusG